MIWLFIACLLALVLILEQRWADWAIAKLRYFSSCSHLLAEPGQTVTLTSGVENPWFLPVMYVRITTFLPPQAAPLDRSDSVLRPVNQWTTQLCLEDTTYLLPRRRQSVDLRFSLPHRGWYRFGSAVLTVGDFLGLKDTSRSIDSFCEVVVIPPRCENSNVLRTLGGFLGDISVRRFILEDPLLTVGFREYTGREPMKSISWTQSARVGRTMVKQYDYTVDTTVTVLLNSQDGTPEQMEECYSVARTVCEELEERGIPYDFRTNGDLTGPMGPMSHVSQGLGQQHLRTILYGLGRATGKHTFSLEKLVDQSLRTARTNQSYLLITPPLPPRKNSLLQQLRTAGGEVCLLECKGVAS